jgi:hypothetical protein
VRQSNNCWVSSTRMAQRIAIWLIVVSLCSPFVLMAWYPDIFTIGFRFVFHYYLELALTIWMHTYGLWIAYSRCASRRSRFAFAAFCCISIVSLGYLAHAFTYHVFWGVTAIPALYLVVSDFLSGKSLLLGHNI